MPAIEHSIDDAISTSERALAVVAIASSAGGLVPLRTIVGGLTKGFPAAVVIAQHSHSDTTLPVILGAATELPIVLVASGAALRPGTIYVCPPQQHIIVNADATLSLSNLPKLSFFRPSGDWLFQSLATSFRERGIAVVLSGAQNDGARGTVVVRAAGGTVIAQLPSSCEHASMPLAAIALGGVSEVLAPAQIPAALAARLALMDLNQCRAEWNLPVIQS